MKLEKRIAALGLATAIAVTMPGCSTLGFNKNDCKELWLDFRDSLFGVYRTNALPTTASCSYYHTQEMYGITKTLRRSGPLQDDSFHQ